MLKFIHAADIHLDSALHGLERYDAAPVTEIRSPTRRAFDYLIAFTFWGHNTQFILRKRWSRRIALLI